MALQAEISGEYFNIHYILVKNAYTYTVQQYHYRYRQCCGAGSGSGIHMDPHLKLMGPDPTFAAFIYIFNAGLS
jgi:hypothetical protein